MSIVDTIRSIGRLYSIVESSDGAIESPEKCFVTISFEASARATLISIFRLNCFSLKDVNTSISKDDIISEVHATFLISSQFQQEKLKKEYKGRNAFLANNPPRIMPVLAFSFLPDASASSDNETSSISLRMTFLRSQHVNMENPLPTNGPKGSLLDALKSDRRITNKNIVKWTQQILVLYLLITNAAYFSSVMHAGQHVCGTYSIYYIGRFRHG